VKTLRARFSKWSGLLQVLAVFLLAFLLAEGISLGLKVFLSTPYPLVHVVSNSMYPKLERGYLVVIQGVKPEDVKVGDIVVFHHPLQPLPTISWLYYIFPIPHSVSDEGTLIIHRVKEVFNENGEIFFTTKGDNNGFSLPFEIHFSSRYLVGKAVTWAPSIGFAVEFLKSVPGQVLIWGLIIFLVAYNIAMELPSRKEQGVKVEHKAFYRLLSIRVAVGCILVQG